MTGTSKPVPTFFSRDCNHASSRRGVAASSPSTVASGHNYTNVYTPNLPTYSRASGYVHQRTRARVRVGRTSTRPQPAKGRCTGSRDPDTLQKQRPLSAERFKHHGLYRQMH